MVCERGKLTDFWFNAATMLSGSEEKAGEALSSLEMRSAGSVLPPGWSRIRTSAYVVIRRRKRAAQRVR
jgi:hypothetical protein